MKQRIPLFLCLILWISPLFADKETIYVDLAQEAVLERVYIAPGQEYLATLLEVLKYDFNHNGKTKVEEAKALCDYEITLSMHDQTLKCHLYDLTNHTGKQFDGIRLTGVLSKDRQVVHQLSDLLFKTLYQQEGIASTRFLYTTKTRTGYELSEADYDGANRVQLLKQPEVIVTPCYFPAPAGKKPGHCCFVSYVQGEPKLYISPLKEFTPQRISLLKGNQITPSITRQSDKIAFVSDTKGNPDLYIVDFEPSGSMETPRRIYGFPKAAQASPTFSPDGKRVAFVSNKDGSPRIYALTIPRPEQKIRALKPELLTTLSKESTAPAWSPDGKKLAYSARDSSGIRQIFIYDFMTKKEKQLTSGQFHKENPSWGANSLHLLYNTASDQETAIYMIDLNEKKAVKIELGLGENRFPSWS